MKISVITGIYHPNETLFRKFLHSCLNQILDDIQFIFIFDDPEDTQTRNIVAEYKTEFDNNKNTFTVLENESNLGIYATQFKGVKNALGEYIVFFDNDDFFDKDYLETMYKYAKEFNANVIKGFALTHYFGNIDLNFTFICKNEHIFNEDDWLYMYKRDFFLRYINYSNMYTSDTAIEKLVQDKFLEKEIILQIPFYEGTFYHYVRHCNNTSFVHMVLNETSDEDQKRIYERFMNNIKDLHLNSDDDIAQAIQKHLQLDNNVNNFTFDELKGL